MSDRYGHKPKWEQERDNLESEAIWVGRHYMEGEININEVETYLNRTGHYQGNLTRTEVAKLIAKGAKISEQEGKAVSRRVQPEQEPGMKFRPRRNAGAGGKLADRPEHTKWKPPVKQAGKGKRSYAERPRALNEYEVKAQRKRDLKILLDKHTRGQKGVKAVKRESKSTAQGKAYKNVVYNETHHRYVGKNRLGATAKRAWDYVSKRKSRAKKVEDKYLFTYSQGGATNRQVTVSAPTKEQAKTKFKNAHPQATRVDIRLVMRGE